MISLVNQGILEKMTGADELKKRLERLYHVKTSKVEKPSHTSLLGERFSDLLYNADTLPSRIQKLFTIKKNNEPAVAKTEAPLRASTGKPSSGGSAGV